MLLTSFSGQGLSSFGDTTTFKNSQISLLDHYSPWSSKNLLFLNLLLINLLIYCLPSKQPNFPFRPWTIVHGGQKIELAQEMHASRGGREMHANLFCGHGHFGFRDIFMHPM